MSSGIYTALSGAKAQSNHLEVIANNLANINTVGFRSDDLIFSSMLASQSGVGQSSANLPLQAEVLPNMDHSSLSRVHHYVQIVGGKSDFAQGRMISTGNKLDMAIQGQGLFVLQGEDETFYTRDGSFSLNEDQELQHSSGKLVLDENDSPIRLDLSRDVHVQQDGRIMQKGREVARVKLVKFEKPEQLMKKGHSLFYNSKPATEPELDEKSILMSGMLESSNVNAVAQMTKMIAINRRFDVVQQLIKQHFKLDEESIQRIGQAKI